MDHNKAMQYFIKMLQCAWKINDSQSELKAYDLIGIQYFYLGQVSKAKFYHDKMIYD